MAARQDGRGGRAKGRLLVQVTHLQAGQYLISKHLPFFCPGVTLLHLESLSYCQAQRTQTTAAHLSSRLWPYGAASRT